MSEEFSIPEELKKNIVSEPTVIYGRNVRGLPATYINPFEDWAFKRIFASETSKEVVKAFLNGVLEGQRQIETIVHGKIEYPGEIKSEGAAVFDFVCIDVDGATFLVEVQRQEQWNFKERSLFYTSRLISDHAPKGDKEWKFSLKEVYSISLLEKFTLPKIISKTLANIEPDTKPDKYLHKISLCDVETGEVFYDKLHFIYIEFIKFNKKVAELESDLDRWLYTLKNISGMTEEPEFLKAPELKHFFYLAKYTNLTQEERNMHRTAQQVKWDNQNVFNFALEKAEQKKAMDIARAFLADGIPIAQIVKCTNLSEEEIIAMK